MFNMTQEDAKYTLIGMGIIFTAIVFCSLIYYAPKFVAGICLGVSFMFFSYRTGQIVKKYSKKRKV